MVVCNIEVRLRSLKTLTVNRTGGEVACQAGERRL